MDPTLVRLLVPDLADLDREHDRELEALDSDLSFGIPDEEKMRAITRLKAEHEQRRERLFRRLAEVSSSRAPAA
jgi:hypothetical protein